MRPYDGTYEWYKENLTENPPKEWDQHVEEQRIELVKQWIAERCLVHPLYEESSRELYNNWLEWLNGMRPPIRTFVRDLRAMGFYGTLLLDRRLKTPRLFRGCRGLQLRTPKVGQVADADGVLRYPR